MQTSSIESTYMQRATVRPTSSAEAPQMHRLRRLVRGRTSDPSWVRPAFLALLAALADDGVEPGQPRSDDQHVHGVHVPTVELVGPEFFCQPQHLHEICTDPPQM